jgi:hypothetical protein
MEFRAKRVPELDNPQRIAYSTVWGGIEPVSLDLCTKGVTVSLYSSASGGEAGGDIYYLSVCSADLRTRMFVADVRGHGEQVTEIRSWISQALRDKMNSVDCAAVLSDLNQMVQSRGLPPSRRRRSSVMTSVIPRSITRMLGIPRSWRGDREEGGLRWSSRGNQGRPTCHWASVAWFNTTKARHGCRLGTACCSIRMVCRKRCVRNPAKSSATGNCSLCCRSRQRTS